jgi:long-chain acyl-CoA synthetase
VSLDQVLEAVTHLSPSSEALWFEGRWYRWAELNSIGEGVLERIDGTGVPADLSIGAIVRNDPLCVAVLLTALRKGRPVLTFSPLLPDAALAADLVTNRPASLVAVSADWDRPGIAAAVTAAGGLGVNIGETEATTVGETAFVPGRHFASPPGTAASMLTSGTTGPPKRLAVSLDGLASAIASANRHHGAPEDDAEPRLRDSTSIIDLPLFNISAYLDLPTIVSAGRRICLLRKFEPMAWGRAVRDHKVVVALLVPAAMRMVLDAPVPKEWLGSLKVVRSGSAPLDPDLAAAFEAAYDIPVIVAYGATEFSGALASLTMGDVRKWGRRKRGTVGRAHPGVELRVVDPVDGHEVATGEIGVLQARASQVTPTEPDGWSRTNDLARIDDDGFIFITGRSDDVIMRGGFKIHPGEVARVLRDHPAVTDAAVVGMPDPRLGQVPAAAVVVSGEEAAWSGPDLERELQAWVRSRLAPYAVPVVIKTVESLPRTPTMKVAQTQLLDLLQSPAG